MSLIDKFWDAKNKFFASILRDVNWFFDKRVVLKKYPTYYELAEHYKEIFGVCNYKELGASKVIFDFIESGKFETLKRIIVLNRTVLFVFEDDTAFLCSIYTKPDNEIYCIYASFNQFYLFENKNEYDLPVNSFLFENSGGIDVWLRLYIKQLMTDKSHMVTQVDLSNLTKVEQMTVSELIKYEQ